MDATPKHGAFHKMRSQFDSQAGPQPAAPSGWRVWFHMTFMMCEGVVHYDSRILTNTSQCRQR